MSLITLPAELGALVLKYAVAKYIEAAGSAAGAMTARATAIKAIAQEIAGVSTGAVTIAELQAFTAAELEAKGIAMSTQTLVNGLVGLLANAIPGPTGGLISAAIAAQVNLVAQDVISVASAYIA